MIKTECRCRNVVQDLDTNFFLKIALKFDNPNGEKDYLCYTERDGRVVMTNKPPGRKALLSKKGNVVCIALVFRQVRHHQRRHCLICMPNYTSYDLYTGFLPWIER